MMISDRKASRIFEKLSQTLQDHQLSWVLEQIDEQIAQGKTEKIKIQIYKEVLQDAEKEQRSLFHGLQTVSRKLKPSTKQERVVIVEYTPQERLLLLIDAIENVIVQTAEMEHQVTGFFNIDALGITRREKKPDIILYSELPDDTESVVFSRRSAQKSVVYANKMKPILEKLRKSI